jgi:alkyl hydroperoxide reductase subunit AhpC
LLLGAENWPTPIEAYGASRLAHSNPELKDVPFPMLSDIKRELCAQLGILDPVDGVAQRATFIVNPDGVIQFVYVTTIKVGRNPEEVLRVLDALRPTNLSEQLAQGRAHAESSVKYRNASCDLWGHGHAW